MLTLVTLVGLYLSGCSLLPTPDRHGLLVVAPSVGLAAVTLSTFALSVVTEVSGLWAYCVALALLSAIGLGRLCLTHSFQSVCRLALVPLVAVGALGAIAHGTTLLVGPFLGVVNFDAFFNLQDARFLTSNPVSNYAGSDGLLPLGWSADAAGRFASAVAFTPFIALGIQGYAIVGSWLGLGLVLFAVASYGLFKSGLRLSRGMSLAGVVTLLLATGTMQSVISTLLGQIMGLAAFVTAVAVFLTFSGVGQSDARLTSTRELPLMTVLLGGLALVYPALYWQLIILLLAWCGWLWIRLRDPKRSLAGVFAVILSLAMMSAIQIMSNGFGAFLELAIGVAQSANPIKVFTVFTTELAPSLLLGLHSYQAVTGEGLLILDVNIPLNGIAAPAVNLIALLLVVIAGFTLWRFGAPVRQLLVIAMAFVGAQATFYWFAGSGYALFKLSSWYAWLVVCVCFMLIADLREIPPSASSRTRAAWTTVRLSAVSLMVINAVGGLVLLLPHLTRPDSVSSYPRLSLSSEWLRLAEALRLANEPAVFLLPNGVEAAWIADSAGGFGSMNLTHNAQALADAEVGRRTCPPATPADGASFVYPLDASVDIVPPVQVSTSISDSFGPYGLTSFSEVQSFVAVGSGSYPPELGHSIPTLEGHLGTFRWATDKVELLIYQREPASGLLTFTAAPRWFSGDDTLDLVAIETYPRTSPLDVEQSGSQYTIVIRPAKGFTCISLRNAAPLPPVSRQGALLRGSTLIDSRRLNFVLADVGIDWT